MKYRYIAIEGNIGSGKTTLAQMLAKQFQGLLILEEFQNNPFLESFYKHPERYAFPLELSFLADRFQQLKNILPQQDLFAPVIISDYIFPKTKIFAKNNLNDSEYLLFERIADMLKVSLSKPDLLIYLYAPVSQLQKNIKKRGRSYEQEISDQYLSDIESAYQSYLQAEDIHTLILDTTDSDFTDPTVFDLIIDHINDDNLTSGQAIRLSENI